MPSHSIADLARALDLQATGDMSLTVTHAAEPASAGPDALALAMAPKYAGGLAQGQARAALLWAGADWQALGLEAALFAPRPRFAMAGISVALDPGFDFGTGIHPMAWIHPDAEVAPDAVVGPFTSIGARARIGAGARIAANVTISEDVAIGEDALIHPGARIGARVTIGARFIGQPNCVIGGCGFSFVTPEPSGVEETRATLSGPTDARAQAWARINSLGAVTLGDDVEVGSGANIDRGSVRDTVIGSGTKLDSLVHVGHNARIGRDCLLCGMVGLAGSVTIGDRVVLGGKVGVSDNTTIGSDVLVGGGGRIYTNVPSGRAMLGDPATTLETQIEIRKAMRRLPRLAEKVARLQDAVFGKS